MGNTNSTPSLLVFDHSGSMTIRDKGSRTRYQLCRERCLKLRPPYELWLFGSSVVKKGIVQQFPDFKCDGDTNITNMLEEVLGWLREQRVGAFVTIVTDGEDDYDHDRFKDLFALYRGRGHQIAVLDVCGNVENLKKIFEGFAVKVVGLHDAEQVFLQLDNLIKDNNAILEAHGNLATKVFSLMTRLNELQQKTEVLAKTTEELKRNHPSVVQDTEETLKKKTKELLTKTATVLHNHFIKLTTQIASLKRVQIELKIEKELKLAKITVDIEDLESHIDCDERILSEDDKKGPEGHRLSQNKERLEPLKTARNKAEEQLSKLEPKVNQQATDLAPLETTIRGYQNQICNLLK